MDTYSHPPRSWRLPASVQPETVRLQVGDGERSAAWYREVLGPVPFVELDPRPGTRPVRPHARLGLYHFAVLLPDRAHLGRFAAHLRRLRVPFAASDHAVSEALYLQDPDGLGIEVYADRPREEWPVRGGRLEMTVDPLDFASLAEAAGDAPWQGAPEGTRLGHVHLHVGDLEQARAFYHHGLGLDLVAELPGALFLSAGGYHHHLGLNAWAAGAPPAGEGDARLLEWTLRLPQAEDADEALRSLSAAGFRTAGRTAVDPWGTPVRLVA